MRTCAHANTGELVKKPAAARWQAWLGSGGQRRSDSVALFLTCMPSARNSRRLCRHGRGRAATAARVAGRRGPAAEGVCGIRAVAALSKRQHGRRRRRLAAGCWRQRRQRRGLEGRAAGQQRRQRWRGHGRGGGDAAGVGRACGGGGCRFWEEGGRGVEARGGPRARVLGAAAAGGWGLSLIPTVGARRPLCTRGCRFRPSARAYAGPS